jgi:hypothetical protein
MAHRDYLVEEYEVGDCKVEIFQDQDPQHPDEGSDDAFLVAFDRNFHVVRKNTWDDVGDFRNFIHPRYQVDGWNPEEELPEILSRPVDGPEDAEWRKAYIANCTDQIEVLLLEAGEESDFDNPIGKTMAHEVYSLRLDIWDAWQRYREAHAEWACFTLNVRNHGGGHIAISLGDVYDGSDTDRWGDPKEPDGFVMVKKGPGWHHTPQEVAESVVKEWTYYLDGEVYGYVVTTLDGDDVDSCWGFIGDIDYCKEEANSAAEWHNKNAQKQLPLPFTSETEVTNGP